MKPKPMVEIGGKPILWHIMKIYAAHGIEDFVVCLGYKGYVIKEWFANYALHTSDVTFDMRSRRDGGPPLHDRAVARDARRDRRRDDDRRAAEARAALRRRRDVLPDLRRRRRRRRHRARSSPTTATRDGWRPSPPCSRPGRFGALEIDGERGAPLRREAARRRGVDQRRLLRLRAGRRRRDRRRRHEVGGGAAARPRRRAASSPSTTTAASGRRWTRCASATSSRRCGSPGDAPWCTW